MNKSNRTNFNIICDDEEPVDNVVKAEDIFEEFKHEDSIHSCADVYVENNNYLSESYIRGDFTPYNCDNIQNISDYDQYGNNNAENNSEYYAQEYPNFYDYNGNQNAPEYPQYENNNQIETLYVTDNIDPLEDYKNRVIYFLNNYEEFAEVKVDDIYWNGKNIITCINYYKVAELLDDFYNNLSLDSLCETHDINCKYYPSNRGYDCHCDNIRINFYRTLYDFDFLLKKNDRYLNHILMNKYKIGTDDNSTYNFKIYTITKNEIYSNTYECSSEILNNYSTLTYLDAYDLFSASGSDSENTLFLENSDSDDYGGFLSYSSDLDDFSNRDFITANIFSNFG